MNEKISIFSGSSHVELAETICQHLELPLGKIKRSRFKSGEIYVNYEQGIRNHDVYLVQSFSGSINDNVIELLVMIDAAKRASARTVNVVIPYFGYSRLVQKAKPREPISAKLIADLLTTAGADRLITLDLHAAAIQGFFNIPVDHLTALDLFSDYIRSKNIPNPIIVSPDAGRAGTAEKLASYLDYPCAIMVKKHTQNDSSITHVIGEVAGHTPIIIDDIIDSGSTIVKAVQALKDRGANDAYVVATHPVFSGSALEKLKHPNLKEVVVTDSIAIPAEAPPCVKVIPVSELLANAIRINMYGGSISTLFTIAKV
ncbi:MULTISPECIES: ribose-phosphate diphosphokinase [Paenibacillus]|uniref:ribose-phosphate diphosphokinase n=1 Tax=Paenibacillus TaxID=44249 RepID=UPI0022B869EA|nr:ribose-phosphate diphosphokinase [Paenibacillus caseinilyticus]MCZ8520356.1 ribose-phosphate diphosphokinase [Paenibacillus caseinilyticus]